MPCNTIVLTRCSFSLTNTDVDLLAKALSTLDFHQLGKGRFRRGRESVVLDKNNLLLNLLPGRNKDDVTNEIKRAYSNEVVKFAAGKYGWLLTETEPGKQYEATKRL